MLFSNHIPSLNSFMKQSQIIDIQSPYADISEVEREIGDNDVVNKAINIAKEAVDFSQIKYVGIIGDSAVLGLASTEFNNSIIQNVFNELIQYKDNYEELSSADQQRLKDIEIKAEMLKNNNELIAFQVNPYNIVQQADDLLRNILIEMQNENITSEEINKNEDQIRRDLTTVILASVLAHEGTHAKGGGEMMGEGGAQQAEKRVIENALGKGEYSYLSEFKTIEENLLNG